MAHGPALSEFPAGEALMADRPLAARLGLVGVTGSGKTSLFCAFTGTELTLAAYRHAVEQRYRFFSYGDCMLIL